MMYKIVLVTVLAWLISGCGGGGSTTTPSENSETGYLIDSPVVNMTYSCGGKVDKTITGGKFTCPSLPVTFKVGDLTVATVEKIPDDGNVYIQDIVGVERDDLNNTNVLKLALLMQSLDDDGNTSKEIKITLKEFNTTKAFLEDLNISEVKKVLRKNRVRHIVTEDNAKEHLRRTARKIDKKAPKIILNGKTIFKVEAGETFTDPGASAVDKIDGIVNVVASGSVNSKKVGIYHIKYTATDIAGNKATKQRVVKVIDTTKPTITLKGENPINLHFGDKFIDLGVTTSDNADGKIKVTVKGSVDTKRAKSYTLTYIATDASGNKAVIKRVVNVLNIVLPTDTTVPVITLKGAKSLTLEAGETFTDLGATAVDDRDGNVAVNVIGSINNKKVGTYTLTYTATDSAGNKATKQRTITVKDTTKPTITLKGANPMNLTVGDSFTDPSVTTSDNADGVVKVTVTGSVDTTKAGTYTLTYTATDSAGNRATKQRVVKVIDTTTDTCNVTLSDTLSTGDEYSKEICSNLEDGKFKIVSNEIEGMTINSKTGKLYWTPTPNQKGVKNIEIKATNAQSEETIHLTLNVKNNGFSVPSNSYFFSPFGTDGTKNNHPTGEYNNTNYSPYILCKDSDIKSDVTFYYRGGIYHNRDFNGNDPKPYADFKCSGTKGHMLHIRPWGNEKPKIKFDANYGLGVMGSYIDIEGFEIEGMSQEIGYEDAIKHWWEDTSYYNGNGILIDGVGNIIHNNIIHDVPGAGMGVKNDGVVDNLTIKENVIFNVSWWNIKGTTGIGLVNFNKDKNSDKKFNGTEHVVVKDNLVFSSESRIFSRVFSKGFSTLSIDEGSSMLIKNDKNTTYNLGFLIENNFFLYNGKGISIRWDKTTFNKNTFYNNGTTIEGGGSAFRSNGGKGISIIDNIAFTDLFVFETDKVMNVIDFSDKAEVDKCKNNGLYGGISVGNDKQKCDDSNNNTLVESGGDPFADATNLNFATSSNRGASQTTFESLKAKVEELGYKVAPAAYKLTIDGTEYPVKSKEYYDKQRADVRKWAKKLDSYDSIEGPEYFTYKKKKIYGYKINFKDKSVTGAKVFYLVIPENK